MYIRFQSEDDVDRMLRNNLYQLMRNRNATLLGVGPMSKNCVDAAIQLANQHAIPIMLIASRRQIECAAMGSGYVENWSTEAFVEYVRSKDTGNQIILARDHGGPWQHPSEKDMTTEAAMQSACNSYRVDIESGIQIIHIDPSVDPTGTASAQTLIARAMDLYIYCWQTALELGKDIAFEVGTEEQGPGFHTVTEFALTLNAIQQACIRLNLPQPLFVVGQTGTKVMEQRNIGSFEEYALGGRTSELQGLLKICKQSSVLLKEHNTDYLSSKALALHPELGIHSANVAPEFGVVETLEFLRLAKQYDLNQVANQFLELAYQSGKWEKWMLEGSPASDQEKAIICGHYVFATDEFRALKDQLALVMRLRQESLDEQLQSVVGKAIKKYLTNFGWLHDAKSLAA